MERCPFCGGQLIGCGCRYTGLGFYYDWNAQYCGLPRDIYENGLPEELEDKFEELLNAKGRVPYIQYPIVCSKCGELWPDLVMVPDDEWKKYIQADKRRLILCRDCYDHIKNVTDGGQHVASRQEETEEKET